MNKKILTLIAATPEYGTKMRSCNMNPEFIGVGPIEAAFHTTKIIMEKIAAGQKPDYIFSVGTAGSAVLRQAEIYQIEKISYRDMDASVFGFPKGVTPFADYPAVFDLKPIFDNLPKIHLSTGAKVIGHDEFDAIQADAVDMESYAVARICHNFNIPMIGLRGISDGLEPAEGYKTWEEYLHIIDEKIADYYHKMQEVLHGTSY